MVTKIKSRSTHDQDLETDVEEEIGGDDGNDESVNDVAKKIVKFVWHVKPHQFMNRILL